MEKFEITPIAYVRNAYKEPFGFSEMRKRMQEVSVIEVLEEYQEGLFKVEDEEFLNIIFYFNKSNGEYSLICNTPMGEEKGVFVCRSPKRPNSLGTTTVKLIKREGNKLYVTGLDAIDGTPIIDIKNANSFLVETYPTFIPRYQENPRVDIEALLYKKETKALLIKSAQLHNHFCPGLTVGVMAATYAMISFRERYNTWKDIQVETNSKTCSLDGIQFVTGCTIANKLLTIVDKEEFFVEIKLGKENKGVIVKMKNKGFIDEKYPEFSALRNKLVNGNITDDEKKLFKEKAKETSFHLVETPIEELFIVESF